MTDWQPVATAPSDKWLRTRREGEIGENVCLLKREVGEAFTFGIMSERTYDEWIERDTMVTTITHSTFLPPTHWAPLTTYCVGFLFDDAELEPHVALARKRSPQRDEGKLNGIGRITSEEITSEVMQRIFTEIAGLDVKNWRPLVVIEGRGWLNHVYFAHHSLAGVATGAYSLTEERVTIRSVNMVINDPTLSPTARWLLPLALDPNLMKPLSRLRDHG